MLRLAMTPSDLKCFGRSESGCAKISRALSVVSLERSRSGYAKIGYAKIICALSVVSLGRSESGYAKISSDSRCGELFGEK